MLRITSGSMPTVAVGTQSVGWFTTNYWGAQQIEFEFSLDGLTWASSITVLGGAVTQEWRPQFDGRRAYGKVMYTPTMSGNATFRMRIKTHASVASAFSYVDVEAFQPVASFPAVSFEVSTNGTTWTKSGNNFSVAATSDGGLVVHIATAERYIRMNGTSVIDGIANGTKFVKLSSTGAFQWVARTGLLWSTGNRVMADENGIYYIANSSTTSSTFTSADGSTVTVPGPTAARQWLVMRLSNAGVWSSSYTSIQWSNAASGFQPVEDVALGGGRLVIGIPVEWTTHTITYGANSQVLNVTGSGSVVRPGAVCLNTASLAGVWAIHAPTATSGHRPAVAVAADGRAAILYSTGSTSSARVYHLATRDRDGLDKGGCSFTAPGGSSTMMVGVNDTLIYMLMGKTGSSAQTWTPSTNPTNVLSVGTNNQLVSFLVNRETQIGVWQGASSQASPPPSIAEVFATQNEFTVSYAQAIARNTVSNPVTIAWMATAASGSSGTVSGHRGMTTVDSLGNLFMDVGTGTNGTFTLTDADGTTTTSLNATSRTWVAVLSTQGKWGTRTESSGIGGTEPSAPFSANWPTLDLPEDQTFTANVSGFDPELSPGTAVLQVWDPLTDDWRDNPVSFTPQTDGVYPATLTVTMGADILSGASVAVSPVAGFVGQLKVLFRWKVVDDATQMRYGPAAEFVATWLSDAPSAPTGFAPFLIEDAPSTMTITWTDLDEAGGASGKYEIYASEVEADGTSWRPKSWTKLGKKSTDEVTIEVAALSSTALEATLTITPKKNKSGPYRFALKVRETSGDKQESAFAVFSDSILSLPDIPDIDGRFDPSDPDGDGVDLEIGLDPSGPWGNLITLPDGTVLRVDGDEVVVVEKGTGNRYVYYIRAKDATGQVSQPKRVVAFHGNGATGAYPQRIMRNAAGVVTGIEPMFYLFGITALRFEEGLDGVGYAEVDVASDQLKRRAQESNTTVAQLLDPMSVELVVTYKGTPVFVGPITEVEWGTGQATTYISARGLMSYFEQRVIKVDTEYEPADLADIAATLAANAQAESFGGLGIGTDTTDCGTEGTLPLTAGTTVLDAINAVSEKVDGPEVWIDPATRILYAKPTRGADRRSKVRITSAMADVAEMKCRAETLVTVARVVGDDNGAGGNFEAVYASPSRLATYGRVERNYSGPQLASNAECAAVAQRIVEARQVTTPNLSLQVTITPQRHFDLRDLGVGDVVTVDIEDRQFGRIVGDYRIVNRSANLVDQADGTYKIRLDIEPAIYVAGKLVGSRSRFNPAMATEIVGLTVNERRG